MRWRVVALRVLLSTMIVLGSVAVFTLAGVTDAGAVGGSCTVNFSGAAPPTATGTTRNSGASYFQDYSIACSGVSSGYDYLFSWATETISGVSNTFELTMYTENGRGVGAGNDTSQFPSAWSGTNTNAEGGGNSEVSIGGGEYVFLQLTQYMTTAYWASTYATGPPAYGSEFGACGYNYYLGDYTCSSLSFSAAIEPCTIVSVGGYHSGQVANGVTTYTYTIDYSGPVGSIVALNDDIISADFSYPASYYTRQANDGLAAAYGASRISDIAVIGGVDVGLSAVPLFGIPDSIQIKVTDPGISGDTTTDPDFWCSSLPLYQNDGGDASVWTHWGLASTLTPTPVGSPGSGGCQLAAITGWTSATGDGTTAHSFVVAFGGAADYIVALDPEYTGGGTTTMDGKGFDSNEVLAVHKDPPNPTNFELVFRSGDDVNPDFWCDDGGTWVDWGLSNSGNSLSPVGSGTEVGCGDGGAFCLSTCWVLSTDNPLSGAFWTDLIAIPICGVRWLFEPTSSVIQSVGNQFGIGSSAACSGTSTASMSQLFGCMAGGVIVAPAADVASVQSAVTSGDCTSVSGGGTSLTVAGQSVNACTLISDTSNSHFSSAASGTLSTVQVIESAAVYIFAALGLIFFIRQTLGGGSDAD